jgi:hypothetical protein
VQCTATKTLDTHGDGDSRERERERGGEGKSLEFWIWICFSVFFLCYKVIMIFGIYWVENKIKNRNGKKTALIGLVG